MAVQGHAGLPREMLLDQKVRVARKEDLNRKALHLLSSIKGIFSQYLSGSQSEDDKQFWREWRADLRDIESSQKDLAILYGISGDTGLGKTHLLSVLVSDQYDILPTSQQQACTAAVTKLRYNTSNKPDEAFKALIKFKSVDDVVAELTEIFRDKDELDVALDQKDESEDVRERNSQISKQIKLICKWSGLTEEKLHKLRGGLNSVSQILRHCQTEGKNYFDMDQPQRGKVFSLSSSIAKEFHKQVRPYIDSARHNIWPLVEEVEIHLHSDLLQPGVVLVDLPGEKDAVSSRSQVARQFYSRLDKLLVVSAASRGADNSTSSELIISEEDLLDLETDGKLDQKSLAAVITKIDDIQPAKYVDKEWVEAPAEVESWCERLPLIAAAVKDLDQRIGELKGDIYERHDDIGSDLDSKGSSNASGGPNPRRPLIEAVGNRKELEREKDDISGRLVKACVEQRNAEIAERLIETFADARKIGKKKSEKEAAGKQLKVIPTSSIAYRQLHQVPREPLPGFPDDDSTGIPQLKEWILDASLDKREEHADRIRERCRVLLDSAHGHATDGFAGTLQPKVKLPKETKKSIQEALEKDRAAVQELLFKGIESFHSSVRRLPPFQSTMAESRSTTKPLSDIVSGWKWKGKVGVSIHALTFGAIVRRRGTRFQSGGKEKVTYNWRGKAMMQFWIPRGAIWRRLCAVQLPDRKIKARVKTDSALLVYLDRISNREEYPEVFREAVKKVAYRCHAPKHDYINNFAREVEKFQFEAGFIKRGAEEKFSELMEPAFKEASAIVGKDKMKKQAQALKVAAEVVEIEFWALIEKDVAEKLVKALQNLKQELRREARTFAQKLHRRALQVATAVCDDSGKSKPSTQKACTNPTGKSDDDEKLKLEIVRLAERFQEDYDRLREALPPDQTTTAEDVPDMDDDVLVDEAEPSNAPARSSGAKAAKGKPRAKAQATGGTSKTGAPKPRAPKASAAKDANETKAPSQVTKPRAKPGPKPRTQQKSAASPAASVSSQKKTPAQTGPLATGRNIRDGNDDAKSRRPVAAAPSTKHASDDPGVAVKREEDLQDAIVDAGIEADESMEEVCSII